MTSEEKKGGLPTWAKVLIGLVVVGIIGIVGLIAGVIVLSQNAVKKDPAAVEKMAASIATFDKPLPPGWTYVVGIDAVIVKTVTVMHDADKEADQQMVYVASFPKKEKIDADTLASKMLEMGISTPDASAKFEKVNAKGNETVAGQSMPYVTGILTDKSGKKFSGMAGCLVSPTKNETIFIYGIQAKGENYNMDVTRQLLAAIKSL